MYFENGGTSRLTNNNELLTKHAMQVSADLYGIK
jgi:hypothetical protein